MTPTDILLTDASDIYGGGEFFVLELARSLSGRAHRVHVSCRNDNLLAEKCRRAGIDVFPIAYPERGGLVRNISAIKKYIVERGIAIVHSNNNYDRTAAGIAARWAGAMHVTSIHSFHSIQHNITHWARNRHATDHFLVDGFCVRDLLVNQDHLPASKISVIHLGVDPAAMKRDPAARATVRREFGFADDEMVVGNVGRLVPMKGQEYLVRAFADVARRVPSARLLLVGDGELKGRLTALAEESGASGRIVFAGFRDDLTAVYSAFDVYAHSSIEGGGETFPFAVLQALAQELPAVVTNVGDVAQMVDEGVNGFVVADKDPALLAAAMVKVLIEPSERQRMAEESYRRFKRDFTLEKMTDRVENVYSTALFPSA